MNALILPVILAGGSGTRLWPLSRELYPKQLLPLVDDQTMLQNTITRLSGLADGTKPIVVCTSEHRFLVAEQLRSLRSDALIMIEPVGRDTAPAVAVAAFEAVGRGDDPVLLVLPADHVISQPQSFHQAVTIGHRAAAAGKLVTFGIVPTRAHTGYGYIKKGSPLGHEAADIYIVERFVEKPDLKTARSYVAAGDLWNSGMFMFRASRFLEELKKYAPAIFEKTEASYSKKSMDLDFIRLESEAFTACPGDSIDYAVMEKTADAVVVPLDCGWSDVGSWTALWEIGKQDEHGNVIHGNVMEEDVENCYINATHRMVAAIGLKDHIVVETSDAVLVAHKDRSQEVKTIVRRLKLENRAEATLHRKVYRPWGSYECVDSAERFQVKRIIVKPGARLSLQRHYHRAEHWVVVKGTANVTVDQQQVVLTENQSTYIPLGVMHRLENPGNIPLEIIEIQSGSYLGEDDIERFDDVYGRQDRTGQN